MNLRDSYENRCPSIQNIFDRFRGNFVTIFQGVDTKGTMNLSDDGRIHWLNKMYDVKNKNILECGPLELGHSYMLHKLGCKHITSIESNWFCFLKCLVVKDSFKLNNIDLLFGDIVEYAKNNNKKFDLVLCSGLLYHLDNPVEFIHLISKFTDNLFIWTHLYEEKNFNMNKMQNIKYEKFKYDDEEYDGGKQIYKDNGNNKLESTFCGGKLSYSFWLSKESLYKALKKYGFNKIIENKEFSTKNHIYGECITLFVSKE